MQHPGPAVCVEALTHRFGETEALRGVSFEVQTGEIFGLLGPNGAGKTTTIRILLALIRPSSGSARVDGLDVVTNADEVRRSVGWVPQDRSVDPQLTARENLRFAAGLYQLAPRQVRARADELLELVGVAEHADRLVRDFSGGMRRRLELAMGLAHRPAVLFLDEPTLGLDVTARQMLWGHIRDIKDAGSAILLTTHYLDEADALCDRIAIIDNGLISAIGTPLDLKRSYGRDTLHVEIAQPPETLLQRLRTHADVSEIRTDGDLVDLDVTDLVAVTRFVLDECNTLGVTPRDLWARRTSLDEVFMTLTGRGLTTQLCNSLEPELESSP